MKQPSPDKGTFRAMHVIRHYRFAKSAFEARNKNRLRIICEIAERDLTEMENDQLFMLLMKLIKDSKVDPKEWVVA